MKAALYHYRSVVLLAILCFTFFTRMFMLNHPEKYVFDEVYHAVTAKLIARDDPRAYEWWNPPPEPNTAVDWLHPPLAKYFQAISISAFGENSFGWRFSSVIFGVLVILITYHLAYRLFNNHVIALLSALLASLDGLLLTQSRIAMNDIHVTFFILFTLYNYQVYRQTQKTSKLLLTGISAGLAMTSKWSGVFTIGIIGFFELVEFVKIILRQKAAKFDFREVFDFLLLRFILIICIPVALYIAGYTHMFMQGKDFAHLKEMHNQIWWYQTHLDATHPYQSRPIEWFLNLRPVWIDVEYLPGDKRADIYAFGNPALFWFGAFTVLTTLTYLGTAAISKLQTLLKKHPTAEQVTQFFHTHLITISKSSLFFLLFSYFAVWLPWQLSPRIMFFYHYTPAVPLLTIILSYWLYRWSKYSKYIVYTVTALVIICFALWYPHWVELPVSNSWAESIYFAIPQWR